MPLNREEAAPFVEMVQNLGYKASFNEAVSVIESMMSGLKVLLFVRDDTIQFYCGVGLDESSGFGLSEANAANKKYRFGKFYIDEAGDIALEADFIFDVRRENAQDDLEVMIRFWEVSLGFMKEELALAEEVYKTRTREETAQ